MTPERPHRAPRLLIAAVVLTAAVAAGLAATAGIAWGAWLLVGLTWQWLVG